MMNRKMWRERREVVIVGALLDQKDDFGEE
jgi:hypothetical protein